MDAFEKELKDKLIEFARDTNPKTGLVPHKLARGAKRIMEICTANPTQSNGEALAELLEGANTFDELVLAIFTYGMKCESEINMFYTVASAMQPDAEKYLKDGLAEMLREEN